MEDKALRLPRTRLLRNSQLNHSLLPWLHRDVLGEREITLAGLPGVAVTGARCAVACATTFGRDMAAEQTLFDASVVRCPLPEISMEPYPALQPDREQREVYSIPPFSPVAQQAR